MIRNQNFLFLNLPAADKITRRFMCSYQSPTSLFPPLELLSLAAVYRNVKGIAPFVVDAIAQNYSEGWVDEFIKYNNIEVVVTLIGFECFEEDMAVVAELKRTNPNVTIVVFGYYPTNFAAEVLANSSVDVVIKGEPELAFEQLITTPEWFPYEKLQLESNGTALAENNKNRIKSYNELPMPAYDLVDHTPYHEPMMAAPFGMIQTARGCPYSCNYCVKSFGTRLTLRTAEQVIDEIEFLVKTHHIRSLRFIDDTFTVNKTRVMAICDLIKEKGIDIAWSCLSRTDNVDEQMLRAMHQAGCKRIYFGIESGSQRILDFYKKDINVEESLRIIQLTNSVGIETAGFFMLGLPEETEADFLLTKKFIAAANFDYIGIGGLVLYPGTPLFEVYKDQVEFSLFPYVNRFKDNSLQKRYVRWNNELYDSFLYSGNFLKKMVGKTLRFPRQALDTLGNAMSYQLNYRKGVFHHIQKHKKTLNYNID
jgi:anaerobic magnesium-protoporphyrin IX monomethyl ester cyclase